MEHAWERNGSFWKRKLGQPAGDWRKREEKRKEKLTIKGKWSVSERD